MRPSPSNLERPAGPTSPLTRLLSGHGHDAALLLARLLLGTIMMAHGHKKLFVDGLGRTTQGFENLSIPVAIVSASFVTVVELVGGALLVVGLLTRVVAVLMGAVMAGAAFFVHAANGVFVAQGGWELVGAIGAGLVGLVVAGPGRASLAHLLARPPREPRREPEPAVAPAVAGPGIPVPEPIPPAGLPFVPVVRVTPSPMPRFAQPVPVRHQTSPPLG